MKGGRWTSEGRRMLQAVLDRRTATDLARSCHVTAAAISALACGAHQEPSRSLSIALEDHAGIAVRAWDRGVRFEIASSASVSTAVEEPRSTTREDVARMR